MTKISLLAIDPGKGARTGHAVFLNGLLVRAGNGLLARPEVEGVELVVIERPQWRPHSRENVGDLLDLAEYVGEVGYMYRSFGFRLERVWPSTWKGSVPKDIHNSRVLGKLSAEELGVVAVRPRARDYDHNVVDAIGIGLWKLGRM